MKTRESYSKLQIALHWLIFVLFAVNYIVSDDMGRALRQVQEAGGMDNVAPTVRVHVLVGIAILALTVIRLLVKFVQGAPAQPEGNALLNKLAKLGHMALYVLLVLLPLSGLMAWFGGVREAGEVHEVLVNLTLALIIVHAAAALFHQFVLKDNLMARMRPR